MNKNLPIVGMLIVPKHKPNSFNTILEVVLNIKDDSEVMGPEFYITYLRVSDNKKIRTVWYPDCEVFWTYYEEK